MGKTALLIVMGMGLVFGITSYNIQRRHLDLNEAQVGYMQYTQARNLARTAVHLTLRALDRGESPSGLSVNFAGGSATSTVTTSGDTMWMESVGTFANNDYRMRLRLLRGTKPFPSVNGAVGVRATPVVFSMSGSPTIDGRNYTEDGNTLTGSGNIQGISAMNSADSANMASVGGSRIMGNPPVRVDTTTSNPMNFVNEYIANADFVYPPGTYSSITWGSATNPVIVVCANPDTIQSIKFTGNVVGWGILVVRGNLELAGNFKFHGLVIVYGENNIVNASAATGTPDIIGGLILAGAANTSLSMRGNSDIKFSSAALNKAKNIGKLRYYSILDWYE